MLDNVNHEDLENSSQLKPYYSNKALFYRNIIWITVGGTAVTFGLMTAMNLMPLHMEAAHMSAAQISLAISIRCLIAAPLMLYIAYLSDNWHWKFGRRLSFVAISLPVMVVTIVLFPFMKTAATCIIVYAIFMAFTNVLSDTYPLLMYDTAKNKYWGRVVGLNTFFWYIAVWLGQIILMPMVDMRGEFIVYVLCGLILLVGITLSLIGVKEPPIRADKCPSLNPIPIIKSMVSMGLGTGHRILLITAFVLVACMNIPNNFTPLQAKVNLGLSIGEVGTKLLQYGTISTGILTLISGWAIDKIGAFRSILIGFVFAIFAAIMGFRPEWFASTLYSVTRLQITPLVSLSIAYMCTLTASATMYMAALIFATSGVGRSDTAKMYACNAAANNLFQAIMISFTGWMISYLFKEYYGYAYLIGVILVALGIPIFYYLDKCRKEKIMQVQLSESQSVSGDITVTS